MGIQDVLIDLKGQRFGKLLVIERAENKEYKNQSHASWKCVCDCGTVLAVEAQKLRNGISVHCGCSYRNIKDLVGQKFGKLLVIEGAKRPENNKSRSKFWLCLCDCGNKSIVSSHSLLTGSTKTCGCSVKEKGIKISSKLKGTKRPQMSVGYGVASFNAIYGRYKRSAKQRNISFELTKQEFQELTKGNCFYCGCIPSQIKNEPGHNGEYIYNGVDRLDSSKGYLLYNCVSCCGKCNKKKLNDTLEDFIQWINKVHDYINQKPILK